MKVIVASSSGVTGWGNFVWAPIQWVGETVADSIWGQLEGLLKWLMEPSNIIGAGLKVLGAVFDGLAYILPVEYSESLHTVGQRVAAFPIGDIIGFVTYILSPILDPVIVRATMAGMIDLYILTTALKFCVWVYGGVIRGSAS